jgi:hypothetical protein
MRWREAFAPLLSCFAGFISLLASPHSLLSICYHVLCQYMHHVVIHNLKDKYTYPLYLGLKKENLFHSVHKIDHMRDNVDYILQRQHPALCRIGND